jgi:hypothetical protein
MLGIRHKIRRRDVLKAAAMFAVAAPHVSRAQQAARRRLVAMAFGGSNTDPDAKARIEAIRDGMTRLGWVAGRDLRYEYFMRATTPSGRSR